MLHHAPMHPTCGGPGVQSTPPHLACPTSCSPNTNRGGVLMGKSLENLASELGVWVLGDSSEAGEFGVEEDWAFVALCSCYFCRRLPSPVPVAYQVGFLAHATPPKPGFQWLEQPSTSAHSHSPHSLLVTCQHIIPHGSTLDPVPKEAIPSLLDRALFKPSCLGFLASVQDKYTLAFGLRQVLKSSPSPAGPSLHHHPQQPCLDPQQQNSLPTVRGAIESSP